MNKNTNSPAISKFDKIVLIASVAALILTGLAVGYMFKPGDTDRFDFNKKLLGKTEQVDALKAPSSQQAPIVR